MCFSSLLCFSSLKTSEISTGATLKTKLESSKRITAKMCPHHLKVKQKPFHLFYQSQKNQYKSRSNKIRSPTNMNVSQKRSRWRSKMRSGQKTTTWSLLKLIRFLYSKLGLRSLSQRNKYSQKEKTWAKLHPRDKRLPKRSLLFQSLMLRWRLILILNLTWNNLYNQHQTTTVPSHKHR